jgi:DNA-binding CsgD family transcriptional regulator/PAS domain-containing protein
MSLEPLVEVIYDSIGDDDAYADLSRRLANHVGGASAWIQELRPEGLRIGTAYEFNAEIVRPYETYFHAKDLWLQAAAVIPRNTAVALDRHVSAAEFENSEIYNDLVRKHCDVFHCLGAIISAGPFSIALGIHRGRAHQSFDGDSERALQEVVPHLQRMMSSRRRLEATRERRAQLQLVFDREPDAILLVGADMTIACENAAARLLRASGPLAGAGSGRLAGAAPDLDRRLRSAVHAATRGPRAACSAFVLEGLDLQVAVDPFGSGAGVRPLAQVRIRDRRRAIARQVQAGAARFGFTAAEAAVARALLEGLTAAEIARRRGVTELTVRSQLKSLLEKSGCSRQAELVLELATAL